MVDQGTLDLPLVVKLLDLDMLLLLHVFHQIDLTRQIVLHLPEQ